MSPERASLRIAIDRARRAQIAREEEVSPSPRCSRCGCDHRTYTLGCKTCWNRRRNARDRQKIAEGTYDGPHGTRAYSIGCKCAVCLDKGREKHKLTARARRARLAA